MSRALLGGALVAFAARSVSAQGTGGPRAWAFTVATEDGWESNVRFQRPDGDGDAVGRVSAAALAGVQSPRSSVALALTGSALRYRRSTDLDGYTYDAALDAHRRVTPRLTARATGALRSSLTHELLAQGNAPTLPVLPYAISRSQAGSGGATYLLTQHTTLSADAAAMRVRFDTPLIPGGSTATGALVLSHLYAPQSSTGAVVELERSAMGPYTYLLERAAADWNASVGALTAHVRAGESGVAASGASPATMTPTGLAELRRRFGQTTAYVRAERTVAQQIGIGRLLRTDAAGVGVDRVSRGGLTLHLAAGRAAGSDPADARYRIVSSTAEADVRQALWSDVAVGVGVFVRTRTQDAFLADRGVRITLGYQALGN